MNNVKNKKPTNKTTTNKNKINSNNFKIIFGLLLLMFSLFLFISIVSYIFTWKSDQNIILDQNFFTFLFTHQNIEVSNSLGKLGAISSHKLIYNTFGISTILLPFILFLLSIRILLDKHIFNLLKSIKISIFITVFASLLFGYIFYNNLSFMGGNFGVSINQWLESSLGKIGNFIFIFFITIFSIMVIFNLSLQEIIEFFSKKFNISNIKKVTTNISSTNIKNNKNDDYEFDIHIQNNIKDEDIVNEQPTETIDFTKKQNKNLKENFDDFEIEIANPDEDIITHHHSNNNDNNNKLQINKTEEEDILSENEINELLKEFGEYDPELDLKSYKLPDINLLDDHGAETKIEIDRNELQQNKNKIVETLSHYKIEIAQIKATVGPTITLYEIIPAPGVRISKIKNLEDDIALSLAALGIRIIAPMPGKGTIGIEVPNSKPKIVSMKNLLSSDKFQNCDYELPICLGKTISNETYVVDLAKLPHLLMAGATGQGKSVGINSLITSILYKKHPSQVKFVLIDPKKVELTLYNNLEKHFLAKLPEEDEPIITDTSKVVSTLNSLCIEMDNRYDLLKKAHVRNIIEYNQKFIKRRLNPENGHEYLPYIIVVVDEFADLMMTAGKEVETPIARIAQLARAVGIHLVIATQRPSVNVITGTIKANFPGRIAFRVTSIVDSRTILDSSGANQLIGRGDMIFINGSSNVRLQCGFIDTPEVEEVCKYISNQKSYPNAMMLPEFVSDNEFDDKNIKSMDNDELDELFEEAARLVVIQQQGSTSWIQRKLKLGYNRAGRIMDQLEESGIVGPAKGSKPRNVLIQDEIQLDLILKNIKNNK